MKNRLFQQLIATLILFTISTLSRAYDFEVGGIYYNINSDATSVSVTYETTSYNSYSGSVVIPSVVNYGRDFIVTNIGYKAFYGCSALTKITIPASVTSIGQYAFYGCRAIISITISSNVTSIGESAFRGCTGLSSVTIPNSVASIGSYAFSDCTNMSSINIPNKVINIESYTFRGCSSLSSVSIPNSVTSIGSSAFEGCSSLTRAEFASIESLCKINFGSYNANPLYYAKHLYIDGQEVKNVVIPNSVTSIGRYAFNNCSGLTSIIIPESVTSIGDGAFSDCSGLTSVTINSNILVSKTYTSRSNLGNAFNVSADIILGNNVTSIGDYAFYSGSRLKSITIPESVKSIGSSAFSGCTGLTKAEFASIESLCKMAFGDAGANPLYYAKHLYINGQEVTDLIIPNSVTSISNDAFMNCSGLTSVTIPNSVTSIGNSAFAGCSGLTSVTIPNSVTSIGNNAFYNCTGLTSVTIPNSVTSIDYAAFYYCSNLTSITIPNSVTSIGSSAFYNCSGLTSVTIPNSVTSIGSSAFYNCSGLTSVTIPNSVTSIGFRAFEGCSGLTSVTIPNSVTSIGYDAFSDCSGLKSITIPESVTSISGYTFSGCSSLKSVMIGNGVTSIGYNSFYNCSGLTSVTIPESVTSIGSSAFEGCSSLKEVYCMAEQVPTTDSDAFASSSRSSATLYVPSSAVNLYKSKSPWKYFGTISPIVIYVTGISLNRSSATLTSKGQTLQLSATVTPDNATNKSVTWTSSNPSVATVSSTGLMTAVSNGSATITAKTADGSNKSATCSVTVNFPVPVTGISLSRTSATLTNKGQTVQLTATVAPDNATNKSVTWTSSNTAVATVSSTGLVTAVANGSATITATTADGSNKTATCTVTVNIPVPATGISLNQTSATLTSKGQTVQLTATVTPSNATNKNVTWTSSNTSVATVNSNGVVTAVGNGTATITAKTNDGTALSATCVVTVNIVLATSITLNQTSATLTNKGQTLQLSATITPDNATNKSVTWTSSNTAVATVSSTGLVTAVANGTATITATTADGSNKTATCSITVNIPIPATGISLNQTSASLTAQGQTLQLTATVTPDNATDKSVTWTSSNTAVATVSNTGLVTAAANGSATITATTADGSNKTATCTVTVNIPVPATGISLSQTSATLTAQGQTLQLTATVTPDNATDKSVTWTSSNTAVTTVSNTGLVTAVANGTATITAKTNDGSNKTATCSITVNIPIPATGISLNRTSATLTSKGQTVQLTATVTPDNATDKSVTWTSSNTAVATVSNTGLVTAVANGSATITAKTADGSNKTATCTVTVNIPVPVTGISLNRTSATLTSKGQILQLNATVTPKNATNKNVIWTSSDTSVATVGNTGLVTAIAGGSATITATTADGSNKTATCTVTVNIPVPATGISLSKTSATLTTQGQTLQLTATITPSNATNNSITWTSSNTSVATVNSNGLVTAVANGSTTITAKTADGSNKTATCLVTVNTSNGIVVDGIFYTLNSSTQEASVTYTGSIGSLISSYTDNITIPSTIVYNGVRYSVTSIGEYAFNECVNLKSVTIPESMSEISSTAFNGCTGLTSVTLNSNEIVSKEYQYPYPVSSNIGTIFGNQVEEFIIGNNVTSIGHAAFRDCSHLTSVTIGNNVTSIGMSAFRDCSSLASVTIPNSVTSIVMYAFVGCSSLKSVTIGNGVTNISGYAFYECSGLESVTIGNSVTSMGNYVFSGCTSLTSITCQAMNVPDTGMGCFTNVPVSSATLYVPAASTDSYRSTSPWSEFGTIENHYSKTPVQNVGELNSGQICTAETRRAAWYVPAGGTQLLSTVYPTNIDNNQFDSGQQFAFIKWNDNIYIYSVGEKKILNGITSNTPNNGVLVTADCQPVTITETGDADYPLFFSFGANFNLNVGGSNQITIDSWSTLDDGNKVALRPVHGMMLDNSEMWRIIDCICGDTALVEHYSQTPVQNIDELSNNRQVYTAETKRAAWYVPTGSTQMETTEVPTFVYKNSFSRSQQFAFIQYNGQYYIYCVGEGKILNGKTSNSPNRGMLVTENYQPVTITETGDTDYPLFFSFGENFNINVGGSNQMTIDHWSKLDDGNKVALRPVQGVMLDENEIAGIISYLEENIPGDANDSGGVEIGDVTAVLTLMANPDAPGYNNKAADANGNGNIEIGDITTILTIMAGE